MITSSARPAAATPVAAGGMSGGGADVVDTTPPSVVGAPVDGQPADADLVYTYSEPIRAGSGTVSVTDALGQTVFSADVASAAFHVDGNMLILHLPQRLDYAMRYNVTFAAGTIEDLTGNTVPYSTSLSFKSGLSPVAVDLTGTDGNDTMDGSNLGDTLSGGAGGDTISGHDGDDLIHGGDELASNFYGDWIDAGAGNDTVYGDGGPDHLSGGSGNDLLYGGDDDDDLDDSGGDDLLDGGAGNDWLSSNTGMDTLRGGDGNDTLSGGTQGLLDGGAGNDSLAGYDGADFSGGAGNDSLAGYDGADFSGGDGDDMISVQMVTPTGATSHVDGGNGSDLIQLIRSGDTNAHVIARGGAGSDTFALLGPTGSANADARIDITDFTPGAGGDVIDFLTFLPAAAEGNPFASGLVRLVADGADTLLQLAQQTVPASGWIMLVHLVDISPAQLTAANFAGGIDPDGNSKGLVLTGTDTVDALVGMLLDDTVSGLGGDDVLYGNGGNDVLDGGDGADSLYGGSGNDTLHGGAGNDTIAGADGMDRATWDGRLGDYAITHDGSAWTVADRRAGSPDGSDTVADVERFVFSDRALALDTDGVAGQAYRIYRAAFDRTPDGAGLGFWIGQMDKGTTLHDVAQGVVRSQEFTALYGTAPTNAEIVGRLYQNTLHRAPEQAGYDFWLGVLDNKQADLSAVLAAFSESAESQQAVAALIADGIVFTPYGG